ncbi:MAG: hypothetical protein ACJARJ_002128 [Neptuniibacter pectenicola]|jgi:hypothetical protein
MHLILLYPPITQYDSGFQLTHENGGQHLVEVIMSKRKGESKT